MPQDESQIEAMLRLSELEREDFMAAYRSLRLDYDRGTLDSKAYWEGVLRSGGVAESRIAQLDGDFVRRMTEHDIASWMVIRDPMVEWARQLKKDGRKLAILSNMPADHTAFVERSFDWLELFEVKVFSYAVRLIKPERAIYDECIRRLGVAAEEAIFVDDVQVNVDAARQAGIHSIFFRDPQGLSESLSEFPGLPRPSR
jgi:putative hydrolase of the HAD superfamily